MTPPLALADVLITGDLQRRTARAPILTQQNEAFHGIARALSDPPQSILQHILEVALELTEAGSAGLSLLETTTEGEVIFRWVTVAGKLKDHVGGSAPRDASPCGVTLDAGDPQLFAAPARHFDYIRGIEPAITEALVVPVCSGGLPSGTVWVVSHRDEGHFDMEDTRVMVSLAGFLGFAVKMLDLMNGNESVAGLRSE